MVWGGNKGKGGIFGFGKGRYYQDAHTWKAIYLFWNQSLDIKNWNQSSVNILTLGGKCYATTLSTKIICLHSIFFFSFD